MYRYPRYLSRTILESAYMITARGDRQTDPFLVKKRSRSRPDERLLHATESVT